MHGIPHYYTPASSPKTTLKLSVSVRLRTFRMHSCKARFEFNWDPVRSLGLLNAHLSPICCSYAPIKHLKLLVKINSVHTRCIVKTSGFTRGVCKNRGFIKFKGFLVEFLQNRRSWENQKNPENRQKSGLFWASPFTMHLVCTLLKRSKA